MTSTTATTQTRVVDKHAASLKAALAKPTIQTEANRVKLALLDRVLKDQLSTVLIDGYYGETVVELTINDGTIQHLHHSIRRMEQ
jgi:hypothetical protein